MKKLFLTLALVVSITTSTIAQLKIYENGNVGISNSTEFPYAKMTIGDRSANQYNTYSFSQLVFNNCTPSKFTIGIQSYALASTPINSGRAIGIAGIAGNSTKGYNYGVIGCLMGSQSGAGIFGSISNTTGTLIPGSYAGFFDGPVLVDGTLYAPTIVNSSDIRLKENVTSLSELKKGETLNRLMDMNVISYNFKMRDVADADTTKNFSSIETMEKFSQNKHFGLSAQELRDIYPELVVEGQDGYLAINYIELVPILIRSIQELKHQVEELGGEDIPKTRAESWEEGNSQDELSSRSTLYQNLPNPFRERTEIRFIVPDDVQNAYIYIFDMTGKMLRQIPIDSSMRQITINGYELTAGIYLYSLVVNGKEIDTKRMILSR